MIYATDLDRTLIFSENFLNDYPNKDIVPVEYKDDKIISYMSTKVIDSLKRMNENNKDILFVAVTTRSRAEFERISLPVVPDYVICSNGGLVIHDGEVDSEFKELRDKIVDLELLNNIIKSLKEMNSVVSNPRIVDDTYVFCKTNDNKRFREDTSTLRKKYGDILEFTEQRNKCYIIPKGITKASTLKWLKEKLTEKYILAVGDSELDAPMLKIADYGFTQRHGELYKQGIVPDGVAIIPGGSTSPLYTINFAIKMSDISNSNTNEINNSI